MVPFAKINRLADLIVSVRKGTETHALPPEELIPADGAEAEAVQIATALRMGGIGGYKVMKPADKETGMWGAIFAPAVFPAPATIKAPELLLELEVAFRFKTPLPGHADNSDYSTEEVEDAVEGALPVYELLAQRWQTKAPALFPPTLINRADTLGNWGLVYGECISDWKSVVHENLDAKLVIAGKQVVSQKGGHVSGNPAHPLTWLANQLARHGHGIAAGDIVTTGAFGGAHLAKAGEEAVGEISGFAPVKMKLAE